ncbi:MAG: oligosaccharide flippase family protein [Clostridia bacterium]|nr:oligosaccharide flippase family protein [Clostridia bacterium]
MKFSIKGNKQIKIGALMSYFAIGFNMLAGLIYTPWMIEKIGQNNYGLYTLATSLITLFVIDFGMSSAVSRFVSKYKAEGDQQKVNNFLGVVYKLYLIIDAVVLLALIVVAFFIESIYSNLTPPEMETFKVLYVIVGLFSVASFPFITLNGILNSYEQFIGMKLADLFHKVFIIVAMVLALLLGQGVFALVTINAISGLLTIAIKLIIIRKKTAVRVNFRHRDKGMLKEIFSFSIWTTVASLAHRLIFNITPTIIAAVSATGAVGVALFGLGQTIEGYVYTFATAINGMFMPRISKIVYEGKKEEQLVPLMIKIGRLQCIIIGLLVTGFISVGKSFVVDIWRKADFADSYLCAVLLIIPSFFYLPQQIAKTTLIVENKVKLQAYVYVAMGIMNVALSLVLSKRFGALGACTSIFTVYMVRMLIMSLIYHKVLKLNMIRFAKETYLKFIPTLLIVMAIGLALEHFNPMTHGYIRFLINGIIFVAVFIVLMYFRLNDYEKNLFFGVLRKMKRRTEK